MSNIVVKAEFNAQNNNNLIRNKRIIADIDITSLLLFLEKKDMIRISHFTLVISLFICSCTAQTKNQFNGKTIQFSSTDNVMITGDYYPLTNRDAPLIILFHQAGYSRGEYREIAPKLNALGFKCLAVDQRSGKEVNAIKNATFKDANSKGLKTKYIDALPDLLSTISYAKTELKSEDIIIWGSSYSAALVLYVASQNTNIRGVLSFSPGEYFTIKNKKIETFCAKINCPVFITSAKNEEENWIGFKTQIKNIEGFVPENDGGAWVKSFMG